MLIVSLPFFRKTLMVVGLLFASWLTLHQLRYTRTWHVPLNVVIFPINALQDSAVQAYIDQLTGRDFAPIDQWFTQQARRYELLLEHPIKTRLGPSISAVPPALPAQSTGLPALLWGLKMRAWVWLNTPSSLLDWRTIKIYVVYHPLDRRYQMAHSVGLQRGLIGLVNAVASPEDAAQNNIVIAHEMLHTVGASDKYGPWGLPVYPEGFASPGRKPLFPQRHAEIMAGRIPLSMARAYMAFSLRSVVIGEQTAAEINWLTSGGEAP